MTVVLGEYLRSGLSASGATRKRIRVSFFLLLKKTVVQPSMISVFSQRLHAAARRAIGRFFLYEDNILCSLGHFILPAYVYAVAVCGAGWPLNV